jgi:hypothetical protein
VTTDSTEHSEATPQQEEPEYVIEKIVGAQRQNEGSHLYRISWYVQELTLESGTDQLTGQDKPQQDRAGQSRTSRTSTGEQD